MEQDRDYSCCNDVLFKFLMKKQIELLCFIGRGATERKVDYLTIHNPEIIPLFDDGRKGAMDILASDEEGNLYDFEMQNGPISEEQILRFMFYASYLYVFQTLSGQKLKMNIKHIYCIVLSKRGIDFDGLIRHDIMNVNNDILPGIRHHLIIINMPYINILAKAKGLRQLNTFERIIYALYNDLSNDILELEDKVVNEMNANKLAFLFSNSPEAQLALRREMFLATEELKEERLKKQEEKWAKQEAEMKVREKQMKVQEEQMKVQEEQMKVQEEQMKVQEEQMKLLEQEYDILKTQQQVAIENIMKIFNVSYDQAFSLFVR